MDDVAAPAWTDLHPWQSDPARVALAGRATWPHALLLAGPRGIGKRTLALHFARALLCEAPTAEGFGCGTCTGCHLVMGGTHPDLQLLEPWMLDEDGAVKTLDAIPVDRVRAMMAWALVTSHRGRAKVAVIVPAETMNAAAANALLKTLEEPPPETYLMLVAHQAGRLPATVRSRCRTMAAPRPDAESGARWLAAQGVAAPAVALAQAAGAPLVALALAQPDWQAERSWWLDAFAKPKALSPVALAARIEAAPKEERRDRLAALIDWLHIWSADLARVAAGGAPLRNPDYASAFARLAPLVAPIPLIRYHRSLLRQRALVAHPLQPRLVAETLLLGYRDLFR
jgi:DNA polymerase-3 subunit delta'